MKKRILIVGDIHFVDGNGSECDPEIESVDLAIELARGEDADEVGERFLGMGHNSYTTLRGQAAERYSGKTYTTDQLRKKWEVCTKMLGGFAENVWHEDDELHLFDSEGGAQAELDDHIRMCNMAVEDGHMQDAPILDDFIIRRVLG